MKLTTKKVLTIGVALVTIIGGLAAGAKAIDKRWVNTLIFLQHVQQQNARHCDDFTFRLLDVEGKIRAMQEQGQPVPRYLFDQRVMLKEQKSRANCPGSTLDNLN